MRRMARALALGCLVLIAAAGGSAWWAWRTLHEPVPPAAPGVVVVVPPGETFRAVAERLRAAGVVAHPLLLRAYARLAGLDRSVRCGEFRFAEPISPAAVLALLQSPADGARQVTIPEGFNYESVAGLSFEVRDKLSRLRPTSLAQVSSISGVTPAAISALAFHIRQRGEPRAGILRSN